MDIIVILRAVIFSILMGCLLIPFHLTVAQTICGGIILGIFLAFISRRVAEPY